MDKITIEVPDKCFTCKLLFGNICNQFSTVIKNNEPCKACLDARKEHKTNSELYLQQEDDRVVEERGTNASIKNSVRDTSLECLQKSIDIAKNSSFFPNFKK